MIISIRNYELSNAIDCDSGQAIELSLVVAEGSKFFDKFAVLIENLKITIREK